MTPSNPFSLALSLIDAAHAEDPRQTTIDGRPIAAELLYATRMTNCLNRLHPDAGEPLRLAVRAQHLRRWRIPRNQFPMDRAGYHQWRTALAISHARQAGPILQQAGYDSTIIARIQSLICKERLKSDPDAQALEDVACLVFMEHDLEEFAVGRDADQLRTILSRTWAKMSPRARQASNSIQLPAPIRQILNALPKEQPATSPAPARLPPRPPAAI